MTVKITARKLQSLVTALVFACGSGYSAEKPHLGEFGYSIAETPLNIDRLCLRDVVTLQGEREGSKYQITGTITGKSSTILKIRADEILQLPDYNEPSEAVRSMTGKQMLITYEVVLQRTGDDAGLCADGQL